MDNPKSSMATIQISQSKTWDDFEKGDYNAIRFTQLLVANGCENLFVQLEEQTGNSKNYPVVIMPFSRFIEKYFVDGEMIFFKKNSRRKLFIGISSGDSFVKLIKPEFKGAVPVLKFDCKYQCYTNPMK